MSRRRWFAALACLAVIAGGVRWEHLQEVRDSPRWRVLIGDAGRYHDWAAEIAAGDWLGTGTFYQAPLYPYCLAALYRVIGPDEIAARGMQAGLGVLACLVLALAGRMCFGPAAGWLAGLLLALWPGELFHESLLEKSTLTTLLTAALLWTLAATLRRPRNLAVWCGVGLSIGLLSLVRENTLILPGLMLAWITWLPREFRTFSRRSRLAAAGVMLVGCVLALAPVLVRNRIVGGEWRLTTAQFGPNFYIGNSEHADGTYLELVPEHGTPTHEQSDATAIAEEATGDTLTPGAVSAWWTQRTLADINADPDRWLWRMHQKVALTWTDVELADSEDQYTAQDESPLLAGLACVFTFGRLAALAAFGLILLGTNWQRTWILSGLLVTYTVSIAIFYLFARYRLPLVPILALLAGAGLVRGASLARRCSASHRARIRLAEGLVVALLAFAITQPAIVSNLFPDWPDLSIARMRAVTEFNLGLRLWEQSAERAEVEAHLAESVRWNPEYVSPWLFWGRVLVDFDDAKTAVSKFSQAAELAPERADIRVELGDTLMTLDRPQEALPHLETAVELAPEDVDAQHLLGRARYLTGDRAGRSSRCGTR